MRAGDARAHTCAILFPLASLAVLCPLASLACSHAARSPGVCHAGCGRPLRAGTPLHYAKCRPPLGDAIRLRSVPCPHSASSGWAPLVSRAHIIYRLSRQNAALRCGLPALRGSPGAYALSADHAALLRSRSVPLRAPLRSRVFGSFPCWSPCGVCGPRLCPGPRPGSARSCVAFAPRSLWSRGRSSWRLVAPAPWRARVPPFRRGALTTFGREICPRYCGSPAHSWSCGAVALVLSDGREPSLHIDLYAKQS